MMSKNPDTLLKGLKTLGLDDEEAKVFLYLNSKGEQTALELSRALELPRTRVYRIMERLIEKEVVLTLEGELGSVFQAVTPSMLNKLYAEKELELAKMSSQLAILVPELEELRGTAEAASKVVHYRGTSGMRQMVWNTLSTEDELLIIEIDSLTKLLGYRFAEKVRAEYGLRKIQTRQLTNLEGFDGWSDQLEYVKNYWHIKHLPPEMLKIRFEVTIYNDVYAMLTYDAGELFGVEIHNPLLAQMQRQQFEFMWRQSKEMEVLDDRGAARVVAGMS